MRGKYHRQKEQRKTNKQRGYKEQLAKKNPKPKKEQLAPAINF